MQFNTWIKKNTSTRIRPRATLPVISNLTVSIFQNRAVMTKCESISFVVTLAKHALMLLRNAGRNMKNARKTD